MIPYTPHRYLFDTHIATYMILWLVGWALGAAIIFNEVKRKKRNIGNYIIIFFSAMGCAPIFGRLFSLLPFWNPQGVPIWRVFDPSYSGYVFFGAFFGGIFGIWLSTKFLKDNFKQALDFFALGTAGGMIIGRTGCFFAGCCFGKKTTGLFALEIIGRSYARYPTQTLMSTYALIIFITLSYLKYKNKFDGELFIQFLLIYSVFRFLIEFLRVVEWSYLGLSGSQYISLFVFITTLPFYIFIKKQKTNNHQIHN